MNSDTGNAISDLLARYSRAISHDATQAKPLVDGFNTLRLADAALDKLQLNSKHPEHPTQIVVLGPTQAGKSTLCNLLMDANVAGISALAGYTVHAQGFATGVDETQLQPLEALMLPLQRIAAADLSPSELNQFMLETVNAGNNALVNQSVVWDTPDFDSIESSGYRSAVLQAAAMADVLIMMVSKDKYADKTVWDMLRLVRRLGKPMFVCINKLDEQDRHTVVQSFQKRHREQFESDAPTIVTIPFVAKGDASNASTDDALVNIDASILSPLEAAVRNSCSSVERTNHQQHVHSFIDHHWASWMAPIEAEHSAVSHWQAAVNEAVEDAKSHYAKRYLDNPQKYDTFNKAIAELLTLLEIPGIAGALSKTRSVVTWPARKLLGAGKKTLSRASPPADQELAVLELALDRVLTNLQGHILVQQQDDTDSPVFWPALYSTFAEHKDNIRAQYLQRAKAIQTEFEPRIEAAAQQLYDQLQQQPMLLNSLRAARVSTDAAAVVLAVKSGGLAAADLVIAPAMLSVTTLLTESVLGQYMEREKKLLKAEQQQIVNEQLIEQVLSEQLSTLTRSINNEQLLLAGHEPLPEFSLNKSLN